MKAINHPHVVNLIEVFASTHKIFLVMEWVAGGELFDKIGMLLMKIWIGKGAPVLTLLISRRQFKQGSLMRTRRGNMSSSWCPVSTTAIAMAFSIAT